MNALVIIQDDYNGTHWEQQFGNEPFWRLGSRQSNQHFSPMT
jgi:hypothetical protein